jgi:hypothetical protein
MNGHYGNQIEFAHTDLGCVHINARVHRKRRGHAADLAASPPTSTAKLSLCASWTRVHEKFAEALPFTASNAKSPTTA